MQIRLTRGILSLAIGVVLLGWGLAAAQETPHDTQQRAAASSTTEAKAGDATSQDEISILKKQLSQQQAQIDQLLRSLQEMKERLDAPSRAATQEAAGTAPAGQVASLAPVIPSGTLAAAPATIAPDKQQVASLVPPAPGTAPVSAPAASPQGEELSPLQIHVGGASITPIGFMDFTSVYRSHDTGNGIGTNFASIPYGPSSYNDNLHEFRESMQNSRVGFRVDADVVGAHVIGYMEADFLGNNPTNVAVSSNSNTLRSRLYWVDFAKGDFEVLGGQSWSLITPGREGISPLPGNIFYSQDMDVNYQAGLVWGRIPELRLVYHDPSRKVAFAVAFDSPEQYVGGSSGSGGLITFPAALATSYAGELNIGTNTLGTPNTAPDIIAKLAIDPVKQFHFEIGGVERNFAVFNPTTSTKFRAEGGGGFVNLNFELFPGFRVLTNNFYSDGGGRYIFGQVPDLIVKADGSVSLVHAGSTVSGFEYTNHNTIVFAYYGGIYAARNTAIDTTGAYVGYGYAGAPATQNKFIQEPTFGFNQTFWKNPKYGAMSLIGQYSYVVRAPWSVATGAPKDANLNMVFLDLRYTLPGSAPAMK